MNAIEMNGWIYPKYMSDPLAAEFVAFLMDHSEYGPEDCPPGSPVWHDPIIDRARWAAEVASSNRSYRYSQLVEADAWVDHCERSGYAPSDR